MERVTGDAFQSLKITDWPKTNFKTVILILRFMVSNKNSSTLYSQEDLLKTYHPEDDRNKVSKTWRIFTTFHDLQISSWPYLDFFKRRSWTKMKHLLEDLKWCNQWDRTKSEQPIRFQMMWFLSAVNLLHIYEPCVYEIQFLGASFEVFNFWVTKFES